MRGVCLSVVLMWCGYPATGEEPFRLDTALRLPGWLSLSGESRARYESLEGQFRAGREGSDQLLLFRSLLHARADTGPVAVGLELQDSRTYFGDTGTPLSSSFTNPLDVLQAYVDVEVPSLFGPNGEAHLVVGRQTISIGSKRQIERVDFANVISSFTGGHYTATSERGDVFHTFYAAPVSREPGEFASILDNTLEADQEQWGRGVWAVHYRRPDALPGFASNLWIEGFIYGLRERDTERFQTPNRRHFNAGFRVFRPADPGQWNIDLEFATRVGERRATSAPDDTDDLDVGATQLLARLGYTFDLPWEPNLNAQWYWTSGDEDPDDDRFDQYERLFNGRRTDLNNTSIHGPLTPANLSAIGARLELTPAARWDARMHYSAAFLASATDEFVIADLRDPSGMSGRFIGHTIDSRLRYWIVPDSLRLEVGASAFVFGGFTRNVPGGPEGRRTLFGYTQLAVSF